MTYADEIAAEYRESPEHHESDPRCAYCCQPVSGEEDEQTTIITDGDVEEWWHRACRATYLAALRHDRERDDLMGIGSAEQ